MIVEDDTNINHLLKTALEKAGYKVLQAFSGTEAQLILQMEDSIALVLLDLMLPGIPGEEVLKHIRERGNLPVIALTAKDSLDEKIGMLTQGADDYITKPFEIPDIADMYVQSLCLPHIGFVPGVGEDILFAENLFRMAYKELQDRKFLLCDLRDFLSFNFNLISCLIQDQISIGYLAGLCFPACMTQLNLDPCQHLRKFKRFGDIIIRSLGQQPDLFVQTVPGS